MLITRMSTRMYNAITTLQLALKLIFIVSDVEADERVELQQSRHQQYSAVVARGPLLASVSPANGPPLPELPPKSSRLKTYATPAAADPFSSATSSSFTVVASGATSSCAPAAAPAPTPVNNIRVIERGGADATSRVTPPSIPPAPALTADSSRETAPAPARPSPALRLLPKSVTSSAISSSASASNFNFRVLPAVTASPQSDSASKRAAPAISSAVFPSAASANGGPSSSSSKFIPLLSAQDWLGQEERERRTRSSTSEQSALVYGCNEPGETRLMPPAKSNYRPDTAAPAAPAALTSASPASANSSSPQAADGRPHGALLPRTDEKDGENTVSLQEFLNELNEKAERRTKATKDDQKQPSKKKTNKKAEKAADKTDSPLSSEKNQVC